MTPREKLDRCLTGPPEDEPDREHDREMRERRLRLEEDSGPERLRELEENREKRHER